MPTFVELDDSDESFKLLRSFYEGLYCASFPNLDERESLLNIEHYLTLKREGWYGRNNYHVLLMFEDKHLVGGCICDYFHEANSGMIEFLAASAEFRGRGLGSRLLMQTIKLLQQDAQTSAGKELDFVFGEVEDPRLVQPSHDDFDPVTRLLVWQRWGFEALDFAYVQPSLGHERKPVHDLILMAKRLHAADCHHVSAELLLRVIHDYMHLAMRIPQPSANMEYRLMADALAAKSEVRLRPLTDLLVPVE